MACSIFVLLMGIYTNINLHYLVVINYEFSLMEISTVRTGLKKTTKTTQGTTKKKVFIFKCPKYEWNLKASVGRKLVPKKNPSSLSTESKGTDKETFAPFIKHFQLSLRCLLPASL